MHVQSVGRQNSVRLMPSPVPSSATFPACEPHSTCPYRLTACAPATTDGDDRRSCPGQRRNTNFRFRMMLQDELLPLFHLLFGDVHEEQDAAVRDLVFEDR